MESDIQTIDGATVTSPQQDLRYLLLLRYAEVGQDRDGRTTVLLLDYESECLHIDKDKPLVFSKVTPIPSNRIFDTIDRNNKPVKLINILTEFSEEQFEVHKLNIPSLGNWDKMEASNNEPFMNPIGEPPRKN